MKKILTSIFLATLALNVSFAEKELINEVSARDSYGKSFTISPKDSSVKITDNVIILAPKREKTEYVISGYFSGQIVNKTKNTVIKLKNAYLEATHGEPAIFGEAKTEISSVNGTTNYIVSRGTSVAKIGAVHCKKNLEIGGSGTIYIKGDVYHAIKADDVKLKGSGIIYAQGTKKGSAINCHSLIVEKDKTFSAYLINSKNGVKADKNISIASGTLHLYDNNIALKTDTVEDTPGESHSITLSGGSIYSRGNTTLYETDRNAFSSKGAKIIEN